MASTRRRSTVTGGRLVGSSGSEGRLNGSLLGGVGALGGSRFSVTRCAPTSSILICPPSSELGERRTLAPATSSQVPSASLSVKLPSRTLNGSSPARPESSAVCSGLLRAFPTMLEIAVLPGLRLRQGEGAAEQDEQCRQGQACDLGDAREHRLPSSSLLPGPQNACPRLI